MTKTAVILFNLGGPDRREAIRPFLFNLFKDPAIIAAPGPLRWLLAHWISLRRVTPARAIYDQIGGASPLLANTQAQARALEASLNAGAPSRSDEETRVFIAMRYWHPFSAETARAVKDFGPDRVMLLPLYPQFSTTAVYPEVPIILFPRGVGALYYDFASSSGADGLSLDTGMPLAWAHDHLQDKVALQGNLDPLLLVSGGAAMEEGVGRILDAFGAGRFIFNLGHGLTPEADPDQVAKLVELVRGHRR